MSAAGAEIDRVDGSGSLDDPSERGEVLSLRVDRALDVSLGSRTELIRDEFFMSFRHGFASDLGVVRNNCSIRHCERSKAIQGSPTAA
jgi:hypothetical protein